MKSHSRRHRYLRHDKPDGKKPNKHRYVKGYHRGLELYGGQASRLKEPHISESLSQRGLVVVEGMNEVLRMESLGVCAVGLGSNSAAQIQVATIIHNARAVANNRVLLLPGCDKEGETAFQTLMWQPNEVRLDVRLAYSSLMFNGQFSGRQPKSFNDEEWELIDQND